MSEKKMVEILNDDSHNGWAFPIREAARRIDALTERVEKLERASDPPKPAEPEGVWVKPGMRVSRGGFGMYTVRKGTLPHVYGRGGVAVIEVWNDAGYPYSYPADKLTYIGHPVLGYEEDKT